MEVLAPALSTLDGGGPAAGAAKDPFFGMRLRGAPPAIVLVPDGDALLAEQAHTYADADAHAHARRCTCTCTCTCACTCACTYAHVHVVGTVHMGCSPPRPVRALPSRAERHPAATQVAGTAYALLGGYARASRSWTPGASDSLFRYTGPKGCRVRALRSGAGVAAAAAAARDADVLVVSAETLEGAGLSELLMRSAVVVAVDEADASLRGAGGGACARCLEAAGAPAGSDDGDAEGGGSEGGGGEGGGAVRLLVGATLSESLVAQAVAQRWLSAPLTLADGEGRAAEWAPPAGKGGSVGRRVDVDVVDVVRGRGVGGVGDGVVLGGNDGEVLGVVLASAGGASSAVGAGGAGSADGVVLGGDGGEVLGRNSFLPLDQRYRPHLL